MSAVPEIHLFDHLPDSPVRNFETFGPHTIGRLTICNVHVAGLRAFVSTTMPCLAEVMVAPIKDLEILDNDKKIEELVYKGITTLVAPGGWLQGFDDESHIGLKRVARLPEFEQESA